MSDPGARLPADAGAPAADQARGQGHAQVAWQAPWDDGRVERLGEALVSAVNIARLGLAVVRRESSVARVVYVSDVGAEIMGYPKTQILDRPATSFLSLAEQALYPAAPTPTPTPSHSHSPYHHGASPARTIETTVLTEDGRQIPCEVTMAPVDLGGESLMVVFFQDISERHRATEALRQSEARFRALIERAPDAVWVSDGPRLLYVNSASVRMLGYDSMEELLARQTFDIIDPEDHAAMAERTRAVLAGANLPPHEYRTRRKDGVVFVTEVQSMAVEWENRKALLGFGRDVTLRKEMEAKLGQSERLAALGTLLAGIAHEMNNPLAYVLLGLEKAVAEIDAMDRPAAPIAEVREILGNVRQGVDRVAAIVRQLRASSRPEGAGEGPFKLQQVLESALRMAGNEIRHRAQLVTSFHDIPEMRGDAQRLEQVFLNLLINAAQALPEGRSTNTIQVTAYAQPPPRNMAVVEIQDNGAGIAPHVLPRIFDPFFSTKPVGVGTGLGLSICHGIVTAHGGTLSVDSIENVKTTFRVTLPLDPAGPAGAVASAPAEPLPQTSTRTKKVLVVDDEPSLGLMIRQLLQSSCSVDLAATGREALTYFAAVGAGGYDVILCDLMMPEMTGMDLYAAVLGRYPGMERRFVFMTGGAFTPMAEEFLASVRNRRLDKPFDVATLRLAIDASS
jgi:PAS domain S-box-containing protein